MKLTGVRVQLLLSSKRKLDGSNNSWSAETRTRRIIPRLYSKHQANKELRNMLNLGAKSDASDVSKLSDQELISTLAQQAKELGIDIKLDYTFHLPKKDEGDSG